MLHEAVDASTASPPGLPALIGAHLQVPLATGGSREYCNLDYAASAPALEAVADAVMELLPWYSSVHRGAGFTSQVSTRVYEAARRAVAGFVGARPSDRVIFVRNTTEALNLAAACLPLRPGHTVLSTTVEHHANMLPWRRKAEVRTLEPQPSADALLCALREPLQNGPPVDLVAMTGASNVTGEVYPLREIAAVAHEHGALLVVDAAQLAPHRPIDMASAGVDVVALSGHKLYAPFGAGALIGPAALLDDAEPFLAGGGAVTYVTLDDVEWAPAPERHEAGSPNVVGAAALGVAATVLQRTGMDRVAAHERQLLEHATNRMSRIPNLHRLTLWPDDGDRVGLCTFTVDGMHHALVAAALSAEHGIGVRHGCFCAHPYITHLLGVRSDEARHIRDRLRRGEHHAIPGAVRASFGLGTEQHHIDRLCDALESLCTRGPALRYAEDPATGDFMPISDARRMPVFDQLPPLDDAAPSGSGCGHF